MCHVSGSFCSPRNDWRDCLLQLLDQKTVEKEEIAGVFAKVSNFLFP